MGISSRLGQAGSNTATQIELNKKREAELARLKAELEELNISHEGTLAALRMKHNNTMSDLGEQIDNLNGNKVKAEKDKAGLERDLVDARGGLEDAVKGKADLDKQGKLLQGQIGDSNQKLDEMARALNENESTKKRLQVENQDLNRQIEELEAAIANGNKSKISLTTELENVREKIDNEHLRKSDALKALSKAQAEYQLWRSRYETEGMGKIEELEGARGKLQARIVEAEENVDALNNKIASAEKSKNRLMTDLDDTCMEYERVHAAALITEKRSKNFDKVLGEWQAKAGDVAAEIEASQNEGRNYSSELYRLKSAQDEAVEQLDIVKRENKNLADEIKDLLDQLGDGGRSIHDLEKEKEELQAALEEAEGALEQEENKVLRSQLEL